MSEHTEAWPTLGPDDILPGSRNKIKTMYDCSQCKVSTETCRTFAKTTAPQYGQPFGLPPCLVYESYSDFKRTPPSTDYDKALDKVYLCDPALNTTCVKTNCFINSGYCRHTINILYSLRGPEQTTLYDNIRGDTNETDRRLQTENESEHS